MNLFKLQESITQAQIERRLSSIVLTAQGLVDLLLKESGDGITKNLPDFYSTLSQQIRYFQTSSSPGNEWEFDTQSGKMNFDEFKVNLVSIGKRVLESIKHFISDPTSKIRLAHLKEMVKILHDEFLIGIAPNVQSQQQTDLDSVEADQQIDSSSSVNNAKEDEQDSK